MAFTTRVLCEADAFTFGAEALEYGAQRIVGVELKSLLLGLALRSVAGGSYAYQHRVEQDRNDQERDYHEDGAVCKAHEELVLEHVKAHVLAEERILDVKARAVEELQHLEPQLLEQHYGQEQAQRYGKYEPYAAHALFIALGVQREVVLLKEVVL